MKLKKLGQAGFSHWIAMTVFILIFGFVGYRVLTASFAESTTRPESVSKPCYKSIYNSGSKGACVSDIQVMVNWYNADSLVAYTPLNITGIYDSATKNAVKSFQKNITTGYTLKNNGTVNSSTWNAFCKPLKTIGLPPSSFLSAMQNACNTELPYQTTPSGPLLGALGPSASNTSLYSSGFREVVIGTSWASIEPSEGSYSSSAINSLQTQINSALSAGLSPSLDIGVQYPPSWIFNVGGGTQFMDQYGDTFSGTLSSGNDVANAVTDMNVRDQLGDYLAYLGSHLSGVASVRLGGEAFNELRYPSGNSGSQGNAYWFYDTSSQATLPSNAQGWKPGSGSVLQATEFLTAYNSSLTNFGVWLIQQGEADFPVSTKLEIMLPGWGERPGEVATAENNLLESTGDEVNLGLDWSDMLPILPSPNRVVAYTTYADATAGGESNPDPAAYIHSILPSDMLAGGESTGNGNTNSAGMNLMFNDAQLWNWYAINWFFNEQPQQPDQIYQSFISN